MELDRSVRLAVYRSFVERFVAPTPAALAEELRVRPVEIEASLSRLAEAHVIVLQPGSSYIWMANPFSAVPTPFAVVTSGGRWWGNCIWDSLGIIAALGTDGRVSTSCPDCAAPLTLEVEGDVLKEAAGVAHFALPAARWWDDIGHT